MTLEDLGWADLQADAFSSLQDPSLIAARVSRSQREHYRLWTAEGELDAQLAGSFRHRAQVGDLPVVGDFVAARPSSDGNSAASIVCGLPRRSVLARKRVDGRSLPQVLAANLDRVFLVTSLNRDFNPRRIERGLAMIWDGGAQPVLVLSKLDLCPDLDEYLARAQEVALGVPTVALSVLAGVGLSELQALLSPAQTVALIGTSGVGKSTLVNALLGEQRMQISEIRESDGRGRHTTTSRELFKLESGALLIDTPGMREFGLWDADEGLSNAFEDVADLAQGCRFPDCQHRSEPGCALLHAVQTGTLEAARYQGFLKLQRELAFEARRVDERAQLEHRTQIRRVFRERKRALRSHPKK